MEDMLKSEDEPLMGTTYDCESDFESESDGEKSANLPGITASARAKGQKINVHLVLDDMLRSEDELLMGTDYDCESDFESESDGEKSANLPGFTTGTGSGNVNTGTVTTASACIASVLANAQGVDDDIQNPSSSQRVHGSLKARGVRCTGIGGERAVAHQASRAVASVRVDDASSDPDDGQMSAPVSKGHEIITNVRERGVRTRRGGARNVTTVPSMKTLPSDSGSNNDDGYILLVHQDMSATSSDDNVAESQDDEPWSPHLAQGLKSGRKWGRHRRDPPPASEGYSRDVSSFTKRSFAPRNQPGPRNIPDTLTGESTPLDFLSLFWDGELWKMLVTETNRRAGQALAAKPNAYYPKMLVESPVTLKEMKAFFGLRITMEILVYKDRYEQYWKSRDSLLCETPGFGQVMAKNRFFAIWSTLHCVDEEDPALDKKDKIYKARPIFNHLIPKFRHYYVPDCDLSLDEGMIPTRNHLAFKQFMKDKPIKWGLKTYLLTDSKHGYICDAEIYTGRRPDAEEIEGLGVTGNLVVRMIQKYTDQNYTLFTGQSYTTVKLATYLLDTHGVRLCGPALTDRRCFPKAFIRGKNDLERGESDLMFNGTSAIIVWQDKKPIYFITTIYVDSPPETVGRYNAEQHRKVPISCPKAIKVYNSFMGGTDKNDPTTRLQKCRHHYKWPRRLMIKFFMWAAYNAYVQMNYIKPHSVAGKRNFTFNMFIEAICEALVVDARRKEIIHRPRPSDRLSDVLRLRCDFDHSVVRSPHGGTYYRCAVCCEKYNRAKKAFPGASDTDLPKRRKTVFYCSLCEKYLCIRKRGANCWFDWHHKGEYWK